MLPEGSISPDLVRRLAEEAQRSRSICCTSASARSTTARQTTSRSATICVRSITADSTSRRDDEGGYRVALIEAFRARGIFPTGCNTLSVESLRVEHARS